MKIILPKSNSSSASEKIGCKPKGNFTFLCHPFSGATLLLVSGRVMIYLPLHLHHKESTKGSIEIIPVSIDRWTNISLYHTHTIHVWHIYLHLVTFYGFSCRYIYLGTTPHALTVTTRIITFLVGNPYKPSSMTVTWMSQELSKWLVSVL